MTSAPTIARPDLADPASGKPHPTDRDQKLREDDGAIADLFSAAAALGIAYRTGAMEAGHANGVAVDDLRRRLDVGLPDAGRPGIDVITALSEEDLAAQVDNFHAQADLLIADYHLDNDVNGVDVVQRITARRSSPLPVLLITANYSNALKLQVRELGHVILHKPVKPMKLKTAMSHLLAVSG